MASNNEVTLVSEEKKADVGVSTRVGVDFSTYLKFGGVDKLHGPVEVDAGVGGGCRVSGDLEVGDSVEGKTPNNGGNGAIVSKKVRFCRKCHDSMDFVDGRGGMWIDDRGGVWIDGYGGLCIDCEYRRSIETDPNRGRSKVISDEDWSSSSSEVEVNSSNLPKFKI